MKPADDIKRFFNNAGLTTDPAADKAVLDKVLKASETKNTQPAETQLNIWRIIMNNKMTKFAAAAMIILVGMVIVNQFGGSIDGAGVVWANVVEKIESVESVVSHLTTNVKMQGLPQGQIPKTTAIGYYSSEYGSRVESYIDDKLSFTMYLNPKENIFVSVMADQKKFMKVTGKSPDELKQISEKDDPRAMVRHIMSGEYKQLGRDNINGIDVEVIECSDPRAMGGMFEEGTVRLWVEVGTDFPVRIELEGIIAGGQMEMSMVIDDFQWNVELDPALFVPDIPSDYTSMEISLPDVDEGVAINGLRLFAELSDGQYPSGLAFMTLMKEISEALVVKYGVEFGKGEDDFDNATLATTQILPAAIFYAQLVEKDAAYYGDKVTSDDVDAILMRWRISEDEYRVIFGDLTTENVSAEDLAELESQLPN